MVLIEKNSKKLDIWLIIIILIWPYYLNDFYIIFLKGYPLKILWILDIIFYLLIPTITITYLYKKNLIYLKEKFRFPNIFEGLTICFAMLYIVHFKVTPTIDKYFKTTGFGYDFPDPLIIKWVIIVYASLSAGILEEIIYRKIIFNKILDKYGNKLLAIIASSLIFSFAHWCMGLNGLLYTFLWGFLISAWYALRREIYPLIIAHSIYDFILFGDFV